MGESIRLQLDDGTTIEAIVEDEAGDEVLRTLGRLRIVADEADVEAHALSSTVGVIVYGPDDVEGHSMTLRLPHPEAARELQRRLLAAGVAGVIVVGAATAGIWATQAPQGTATQAGAVTAPIAAPAPVSRGLLAEREDAIVATAPVAKAPTSSGLRAEREDAIVATAPVAKAPTSSGLQAEREDAIVATAPIPKAPASSGLRAEREDAVVATPQEPSTQAQHQGMHPE